MASSSSSPQLSASVTRILSLSNFPSELKTRDLIAAFSEWDGSATGGQGGGGGFKVKWVDDVNAMIVFQDAGVAKKAYLQTLLHPHLSLSPQVVIRPYDGPDAQAIIQSVNARTGPLPLPSSSMNGAGHHSQASSLSMGGNGQRRGHGGTGGGSVSGMGSFSLPPNPTSNASPPLTHARNPSSGAFASHTRMGSIGSGQASWNSTSNPSPPLANATVVPGSGVAARRESQSGGGGGADAALGEVRRALGLVASAGLARTG
ncbi:hypothetical protein BDY24DRAFT_374736 [Mrakia frigida]|uniref:uncharacterized protein n=1 Tax=Mrakia frigida TaxID=29902 RepID=UPI003FCC0B8C